MWPFNRNKTPQADNVPSEVQEYYQSEQKQRVGIAWLLAGATLLVTALVATGAYFGGRWIYRKIDNNKPVATKPQTTSQKQPPAPGPTATSNNSSPSAPSSTPATTPTPPTTSTATSTPASNSSQVPHTGPGSDLVIATATALGSTVLYQAVQRRRLRI